MKTTFAEHGVPEMVPCSDEENILTWMREKRVWLSTHIELVACRDEFDWLIRCYLAQPTTIQRGTAHRYLY